ncbi:MAG: hypothetical protein Q8K22_11260 [Rhodoferax sp.]|jgi:hypothetical protein|nr:hypothetical protein [Rhodoferax sp.]
MVKEMGLTRAIKALKLAADCGGELDRAEYQGAHDDLVILRDKIVAHDAALNQAEVSPTGDDYNDIMAAMSL